MKLHILKLAGPVALVLATLVACTKETPYKVQYKDDTLSKAQVDTKGEFLYVSSYAATSRSSDDAIPFYQGSERIVKFSFGKSTLDVVEVEQDERFAGNATNSKVILSIPVEHKAFRCATDRFGECKNEEEENKDISDQSKDMFKPDFMKMADIGATQLPADIQKYFNGCYAEKGSKVLGYEFTPDAVNVQIEKTMEIKGECVSETAEKLSDATITTIVYHHSFVKISKAASPDYKAVSYPDEDEGTFGFFTTERNRLDADNRDVEKTHKVFMNRWNPERSDITYYLSDEFSKPENAAFKKAAYHTFEKLNEGLAKAGAKFRLTLKDPEGKQPGDIRNSMIVLVEDPSGAGLLGYGPTVANPYTGEIFSGRVVMYSGILKSGLSRTWEEIRERRAREKNSQNTIAAKPLIAAAAPATGSSADQKLMMKLLQKKTGAKGLARTNAISNGRVAALPASAKEIEKAVYGYKRAVGADASVVATSDTDSDMERGLRRYAERLDVMSKHCFYPSDFANFEGVVNEGIEKTVGDGEMKPWKDLSESEMNAAIEKLAPTLFVQVLIHEVGHNLGLRHNFAASEDSKNWYTEKEVQGLGRKIPYSSVMDYTASETNALPILGKYDVAALRFGYTRKLEVQRNDSTAENPVYDMVTVPDTIDEMVKNAKAKKEKLTLRDYGYCSDEGVGANPNCKRFDEGTNLTEIAQHWINQYNRDYPLRNFRNGVRNFSMMNDGAYITRKSSQFMNLRLMFERYESIRNTFGIAEDSDLWEKNAFLKDVKNAAILSGRFFLDVLRTPDVLCAVTDNQDPAGPKTLLVPISSVDTRAINCFDSELPERYTMVGQTGRFFQSKKDPASKNPYVDQIDVRGIWGDKLIASLMLFKRTFASPIFDRSTDNYTELKELRGPIAETMGGILLDSLEGEMIFRDKAGNVIAKQNQGYSLAYSHTINQPLRKSLNKMLEMDLGEIPFVTQLTKYIQTLVPDTRNLEQSREFMQLFSVFTTSGLNAVPAVVAQGGAVSEVVDGIRYVATPANAVAGNAIMLHKIVRILSPIPAEHRAKLIEAMKANATEVPATIPDDFKANASEAMAELPLDLVEAVQAGKVPLKEREFYARLLTQLPARSIQ